jgi:hypothetical protein
MVDDIANRNPAPQLVEVIGGELPLFSSHYDWKEQERVFEAVGKLYHDETVEGWEEMVRKANDLRYSLTLKNNSGTFALGNWTVGRFCRERAYWQLVGAFHRHLPRTGEFRWRIPLEIGVQPMSLAEWRKKRMNKSLDELQIEVGELTLAQLASVKGVSTDEKQSSRKLIQAEIDKLQTTKRAVLRKSSVDKFERYSADEAVEIRKEVGKSRPSP